MKQFKDRFIFLYLHLYLWRGILNDVRKFFEDGGEFELRYIAPHSSAS